MFKILLLSLSLLLSIPVQAQLAPAASVKEAQLQAEEKCQKGCLILSPEEIAALELAIKQARRQAYEAGLKGWSTQASD